MQINKNWHDKEKRKPCKIARINLPTKNVKEFDLIWNTTISV
jgi:hypothetical protein